MHTTMVREVVIIRKLYYGSHYRLFIINSKLVIMRVIKKTERQAMSCTMSAVSYSSGGGERECFTCTLPK